MNQESNQWIVPSGLIWNENVLADYISYSGIDLEVFGVPEYLMNQKVPVNLYDPTGKHIVSSGLATISITPYFEQEQ